MHPRQKLMCIAITALLSHNVLAQDSAAAIMVPPPIEQRIHKTVEMVFVLDTTGSMGGLIEGAKSKIWRIVNDVMQRQNGKVNVKVGLVAYRDKGDDYITQVTPLSADLDTVYGKLMAYQAAGGGDTPEDVRSAMRDGLNQVGWSDRASPNTSQILFLVGDAPPHDDYAQTISAQKTAAAARARGIRVNTIQVGNMSETTPIWREVAQYGGGDYFAIAQNGGVTAIATPYDQQLSALGDKVGQSAVYYGRVETRMGLKDSAFAFSESLAAAPASAQADRAVNKAINSKSYHANDLIQAVENKEVDLATVKDDELPEVIQGKNLAEKQAYVAQKIAERAATRAQINALAQQRDAYLKEHEKAGDGFDAAVSKALQKQIE